MPEPTLNRRSAIVTQGDHRAPNRAMLRAVGFGDGDFPSPSSPSPTAQHDHPLQRGPRRARRARPRLPAGAAAAMPQVFGTITISDGISMGTEGMKYSLVSREVIADSIETVVRGQSWTGCWRSAAATRTCRAP
jgi:dihydroxy-acid dehydratase